MAIEPKTINTRVRYENVEDKTRLIAKNIKKVIKDIEKLINTKNYTNKAVLFIVIPITHNNKKWQVQLQRITKLSREIKYISINFKNEIPGVIYFGLV